jgi:isoleucyl-tRNA synthetase
MSKEIAVQASFTRIEEEVRRFWRRSGLAEASARARGSGRPFVIYQQPLAAVGQDWADQVRLLATTDVMARYHRMQGDAVRCQIGWACHGLSLEVEMERSLGEELRDLARFNAACREAAVEGVRQGESQATRLGLWLDAEGIYATLTPRAMGIVWRMLRKFWDSGRLKREQRIAPFCPRCATPLSAAEASRRTTEVEAPAIWVGLPWDDEPDAAFAAWTPDPWTLVGMVALAVHPRASYVLVELIEREDVPATRLLLAEQALERSLPARHRLVRRLSGKVLRGARYRPLFAFPPATEGTARIILSDDVPLDVGTGILPVTPAFDPLSLSLAQAHSLPVPRSLDDWGNLDETVTPWRGLFPLDAEPFLVEDLQARGLLLQTEPTSRTRAHCPHCGAPLLPQACDCWMVEAADSPWIVGRDRPWGAPLPVWICEGCGGQICVAGIDDLAYRAGLDANQISLHRPEVDRLTFGCETCGGIMRRVPEVVDAAFEAAVLPWATAPTPPLASLAIGLGAQGRDWLEDLTEVTLLLQERPAAEQSVVVAAGSAEGAWEQERATPSDALRWAAYTDTTPAQAERDFLRPLWRLATSVQRESEAGTERQQQPAVVDPALLDRWLRARLEQTIRAVTRALDAGEPRQAAAVMEALVDDFTGWYVPHRRDVEQEIVSTLARLVAPFAPHLAEAIHRRTGGKIAESVHLSAWPSPEAAWEDNGLVAQMAAVQRLAALGQAARAEAGIEVERLLPRGAVCLLPGSATATSALMPFRDLLREALGVASVRLTSDVPDQVDVQLSLVHSRAVRREVEAGAIDASLRELEPEAGAALASQLRDGFSVSVETAGQAVTLLPDEVMVSVSAEPGWVVAMEDAYCVVLEVD